MSRDEEPAAAQSHRIVAFIPARLDSMRLPGKALADLGGIPMVVRVQRAVAACRLVDRVVVVTDSEAIAAAVRADGGECLRVDAPCRSGTERVLRAAAALPVLPDFVLNVQGDEPFVRSEHVEALVALLVGGAPIATLSSELLTSDLQAPERVKVVVDHRGRALYFSRAPIPGALHLGLYGFAAALVPRLLDLPRSALASAEGLEQLDWLYAGLELRVAGGLTPTLSIDTAADLEAARALLAQPGAP